MNVELLVGKMFNIIIPISIILGIVSLISFIANMYRGAMVLGVLKVFDLEITKGSLSEDNEVIISEKKKFKIIKENLMVSGMIIFLVGCINIVNSIYR